MLAALPVPVAVLSPGGRLLEANAAFRSAVTPTEQALATVAEAARAPATAQEVALPGPGGEDRACRAVRVDRADGSPGWCVVQVVEPAERAGRDRLTGLADRHLLLEHLELALDRPATARAGIELLVVDLDDFKGINDRHGHVVGDEVLVEVAARLRGCVRPEDTVCRWGGDEFVVLVADGGHAGAEALARRLLERLDEPVRARGGLLVPTSASCGWVQGLPTEDPVSLLHRADLQMYGVKRARKRERAGDATHTRAELRERLARSRARSRELRTAHAATLAMTREQLRSSHAAAARLGVRSEGEA